MTDHYGLLGVPRNATAVQITRAYKRAAAKAHPDRNGGDNGAMAAINRARDVLLDPVKRAVYDLGGDEAVTSQASTDLGAVNVLKMAFGDFLTRVGPMNERNDWVVEIRRTIEKGKGVLQQGVGQAKRCAKEAMRHRKRLRRKTDGANVFEEVIDELILQAEQKVKTEEEALAQMDVALKMLDDFKDAGAGGFSGLLTSYVSEGAIVDRRRFFSTEGN